MRFRPHLFFHISGRLFYYPTPFTGIEPANTFDWFLLNFRINSLNGVQSKFAKTFEPFNLSEHDQYREHNEHQNKEAVHVISPCYAAILWSLSKPFNQYFLSVLTTTEGVNNEIIPCGWRTTVCLTCLNSEFSLTSFSQFNRCSYRRSILIPMKTMEAIIHV